jgi:hypothetical protein
MGTHLLENASAVKDGHMINKYLPLTHENIADGSVLFLAKGKPKGRRRRQSRLEMLAMDFIEWEIEV